MRDLDEQMQMIQNRSRQLRQEKRRRRTQLRKAGLVCACLVLIIGAGLWVSGLTGAAVPATASPYGSLIAGNRYVGYIGIGVLSFLLGISVTLLGLHLRKNQDRERDREGQ